MLTFYMVLSFLVQWVLYILMAVYIFKLAKKYFPILDKSLAFFGVYSLTLVLNIATQVTIAWLSLKHDGAIDAIIKNQMGEISALAFADNIIREAVFKVGLIATIGSIVWQTIISAAIFLILAIAKLTKKRKAGLYPLSSLNS